MVEHACMHDRRVWRRQHGWRSTKARRIEGKTTIDATNLVSAEPPSGFPSNAEFVKSRTNGPTAKSFILELRSVADSGVSQETRARGSGFRSPDRGQ